MFCTSGILLMEGSQRSFTKIIKSMREKPTRKSTTINLDRIRCCIEEAFQYRPNDSAIWTSIRSNNIHRLTRNFLWKCMHDIFHVGPFWEHVPNLEILGQCQTCGVPESLEHIMLECDASGQRQVWRQTESFWRLRYPRWPKLNWWGKTIPAQNRFFSIIVSTSMSLIWNLRNESIRTHTQASANEIHNRWVSLMNTALKRDRVLSNRTRFGSLATKNGTLLDEDSLPDNWTRSEEVLVGIRPVTQKRPPPGNRPESASLIHVDASW
ncbi:hypothetical protein B0H13DRAFT_2237527 [Mycena leptocephala]|nr:hypothetical protein B0H13DRAFT_2237527 [Mycena leptocephala]